MQNLNYLLVLLLIVLSSCNAEKKAMKQLNKIKKNHPVLFDEKRDTILKIDTLQIITKEINNDTIVYKSNDIDTIEITQNRVITRIEIIRDSIKTGYRIQTKIKADTIKFIQVDTIFRIRTKVITDIKIKYKTPFWVWVLCAFLGFVLLLIIKYKWRI